MQLPHDWAYNAGVKTKGREQKEVLLLTGRSWRAEKGFVKWRIRAKDMAPSWFQRSEEGQVLSSTFK